MVVQKGFSLIELTVTVALAALVMGVGVPSFQSLSQKNKAEALLDEANAALRLARQVAIEHSRETRLCPRDAGDAATAAAKCDISANGDWNDGWVIEIVNGPTTLMSKQYVADGTTTTSVSGGLKEIRFSPTGTLSSPSIPSATISVAMGGCTKSTAINLSGHLSFNQSGC